MSKESKPTKKATVSKRRPMKKDTVSNDSKPAEESAVSIDHFGDRCISGAVRSLAPICFAFPTNSGTANHHPNSRILP